MLFQSLIQTDCDITHICSGVSLQQMSTVTIVYRTIKTEFKLIYVIFISQLRIQKPTYVY